MTGARRRRAPAARPAAPRGAESQPPLERARAVALRYLAAAARTEAQVRARLDRAELASEADETVRWLLGLGYLDDAAWARGRARDLLGPGRAGPRLAERRLVQAGIDRERARAVIAAALADAAAGAEASEGLSSGAKAREGLSSGAKAREGETALCRALAERRARTADLGALDAKARARLARFLLGRGFAGPVVARVLGMWEDG